VVLDDGGEAYVQCMGDDLNRPNWNSPSSQITFVAIRVPNNNDITGRLFVPKTDRSGMLVLKFTVPTATTHHATPGDFYRVKRIHYQRLADL
jgi:hypothetical protein